MPIASINHIEVDEQGVARIAGTRIKVHILMAIMNANDFSAEQLMEGYPQLSPAQIYAALAYYHDHKEQIDRHSRELDGQVDELRRQSQKDHPELYQKLRDAKARAERGEDLGSMTA